jgi:large subunit ribosomal protein L22
MEIQAYAKSVPVSPRKVRFIADAVSGMKLEQALATLEMATRRGSVPLMKTIESAIANAVHNAQLSRENLMLVRIDVTEGPSLKRFHPSTRGRVHPYKRRMSHIRVTLREKGAKISV